MVGKWLQVQFATDDNGNGVMDQSEVHDIAKNVVDILQFKADSTGYESILAAESTMQYPFTWLYLTGDSLQRNGVGHDTIFYSIARVDASNMTLSTITDKGLVWYLYNKE